MKKKTICLIVIGILFLIILIDFSLMLIFNTGPLFAIRGNIYKDGDSREYYGIGYKVLKCKTLRGDNSIKIGFYNMKYSCKPSKIEKNKMGNTDNDVDTSKCIFINTLKVINVLDYQSQDNETKYLAVDFFQGSTPFIIKTKLNTSDLIKNQYYEFTFDGFKKNYENDYNLILFDVIKIEKIDKIGLDQTNEACN